MLFKSSTSQLSYALSHVYIKNTHTKVEQVSLLSSEKSWQSGFPSQTLY